MHRLGLPVPPAFVIDTEACRWYRDHGREFPDGLAEEISAAVTRLEAATGKRFGSDIGVPLLVSVRSGAKVSMPGMMDTVLNLGLDRHAVLRLAGAARDPGFAVDTWMRFWSMFADTVLDVDPQLLRERVAKRQAEAAGDLSPQTAAALEEAVLRFLEDEGATPPVSPREQLWAATRAVFESWDSRRAKTYRAHHGIPDDLGTAVVVQAMVFGNLGTPSGSGVAFTRDPKTGKRELFGEYLPGGQGEEVVAGTTTPVDLHDPEPEWIPLKSELERYGELLESEYRDALDIEFTVENGKLYLLQVRPAKRTALASVQIATDLVQDKVIEPAQAVTRVTTEQVKRLVSPEFDPEALARAEAAGALLARGIGASPGHGSGVAVLDADRAAQLAATGTPVVLVRPTTSPQDLRGMLVAEAIVTARGGATSHAAVVSRALDKPCVVGCETIDVRPDEGVFFVGDREFAEGDELSVDGVTGAIFAGVIPRSIPERSRGSLAKVLGWADELSDVCVWLPVSGASAVPQAVNAGAHGLAVVALTDLLIAEGAVDRLVEAIETLSANPDAPTTEVEDIVERDVYAACRSVLEQAQGYAVDLRLPNLTSARARRMISEWTSLAPHLLLPLGPRRLLAAYLRALDAAARDARHDGVTVLIGGITDDGELAAFSELVQSLTSLDVGAVLQNPTVLFRPGRLIGRGHALWVDLHELIRTAHGYPEELLFTIEELATSGALGEAQPRPGRSMSPLVQHLLDELVDTVRGECRLGVDLAGASYPDVAPGLYAAGFRHFTSLVGQSEELRLLLGQLAVKELPDA
ncbi:pyruvate, phosphate dikinase [Carbonactinospora thermoautotrophica]